MAYDDYQGWLAYFQKRPPGWREDLRTFRIMQAFGTSAKAHEVFHSLQLMQEADRQDPGAAMSAETLKSSAVYQFMQMSVNGDRIGDILDNGKPKTD